MYKPLTSVAALFLFALFTSPLRAEQAPQRLLTADDINSVQQVSDPRLSPEGDWVAYTVGTTDLEHDKYISHIWMTNWDGKRTLQLTRSRDGENSPRWSGDGRYLAFLSARGKDDDEHAQLWLLNRTGGEAEAITAFKGDVLDYAWSPDATKIALIVMDEDPSEASAQDPDKTVPPLVINRYYFKEDITGYLGDLRHHLYLLDVATHKAELLTPGNFDEALPIWSPDGSQIAFTSKRTGDPDRNYTNGLYVIEARAGSEPRLLANYQGDAGDSGWTTTPSWRPDGREIALTVSRDGKLMYYSEQELMIVPVDGGQARVITTDLDRNILSPRWSGDGKWIYAFIEDDRNQHFIRMNPVNGKWEPILQGRRETTEFDLGPKNRTVLVDSTHRSPERNIRVGKPQDPAVEPSQRRVACGGAACPRRRNHFPVQRWHADQWLSGHATWLRRGQ